MNLIYISCFLQYVLHVFPTFVVSVSFRIKLMKVVYAEAY